MSSNSYFSEFQNFIQGAFPIAPTLPPQLPSYNIVSTDYVTKLEQHIAELRTKNSELEKAIADLTAEMDLMKTEDYEIKNEIIECKDAEINYLKCQVEFLQKEKYNIIKMFLKFILTMRMNLVRNQHECVKTFAIYLINTNIL